MHGNDSLAPTLMSHTLRVTPGKARPAVCILCAKVYEFHRDADAAHRHFRATVCPFPDAGAASA
jgi:hypothetical protein